MAKVSVIVTVYNVEKYITRCIASILSQDYEDFELIVVDDGSPDSSMDIVKSFVLQDSRIRIITSDGNHGLMCARRLGYMQATGKYIVFVDSDDTIPQNALSILYKSVEETGADIVAGTASKIMPDGSRKLMSNRLSFGSDVEGVYKSMMKGVFLHNMWGKVFKKQILQNYEYQYFDKLTNAEDICLFYQIIKNVSKVECINDVVYEYRINSESSSQVKFSIWRLECFVIAYDLVMRQLSKVPSLSKLSVAYAQRSLSRLCAKGYNSKGEIDKLLERYSLSNLFTVKNIFRNNSFKDALIVLMGRTRIGSKLYLKHYGIEY